MSRPITQTVAIGQRFGRLIVCEPEARNSRGNRCAVCVCDCGNEVIVPLTQLIHGRQRSCGCYKRERMTAWNASAANAEHLARLHSNGHGLRYHPLYATWLGMMHRCYRQAAAGYQYYGGRGIIVCSRWHDVTAFIEDIERELGPRPEGMTLDRYPNNSGNYESGNIRWATWPEQLQNRRPAMAAMATRRAR